MKATMAMRHPPKKTNRSTIHDRYRELLKAPDLTKKEIDAIRRHVQRLAQAICEHVWGKNVF
jgi:hypothetical protein